MRRNPTGSTAALQIHVQRGVLKLLYVALLLSFALLAKPARALAEPSGGTHGTHPQVRLTPEGWGNTRLADLQLLLDAVAELIGAHFPQRDIGIIRVIAGESGPMAFYDKSPEGDYVIQLSARHSRWHQFVYQFSHELCHVYSNFDGKPPAVDGKVEHRNQWFEESVCEAAALYTLKRLAAQWAEQPPAPQFAGYDATLNALAAYLVNEPHRRLPYGASLAGWFQGNRGLLEADPYLRDKNEVVANQLLSLLEQEPDALGAIGYLNAHTEDAGKDFADYLGAWFDACPERHRMVVGHVMALFGEAAPRPALALGAPPPALVAAQGSN